MCSNSRIYGVQYVKVSYYFNKNMIKFKECFILYDIKKFIFMWERKETENGKIHKFRNFILYFARNSAMISKCQSENSVKRYVDRTSLLSGFVKILHRIRATWPSIYGFFDPLEILGAFTELRKVRFGARKSHMYVYLRATDIVKLENR